MRSSTVKVRLTVEVSVESLLTKEEELTSRQLQNISGAVRRVLQHRAQGLVGVELGMDHELEWASKLTNVSVTLQTKA
jgi:hypothetical protein